VILSGKGVLCVEGKETELREGQMFVTKPGEKAWYRADEKEPWEYYWMAFDGKLAEQYVISAGFEKGVNWRDCHLDYRRYKGLVKYVLDKPEMSLANDIHRLAILLEYIAAAVEDYQVISQGDHRLKTDYTDSYVEYAVNYIHANFATAKVSDVAHYIGIHRSYLTSIFRKKLGVSPQEFLMQVKLDKAKQLLLDSQAPVQEVSQMVGYENPLTFSKSFKNRYGLSPKAYRLRNTAREDEAGSAL
jgi:AraC family transcriptional regulator of arabinose operon